MEILTELFTVHVPEDAADNQGERDYLAYIAAEEMARDWVSPCIWTVLGYDGDLVTVERSYRRQRGQ